MTQTVCMLQILTVSATSFLLSYYLFHKIIYIAHKTELFDHPNEQRKIHLQSTPNLGGAAIFICLLLCSTLYTNIWQLEGFQVLSASFCMIFLVGITDDLVGMNPYKKFTIQAVVATLVALGTEYRLSDLHGFLGIEGMTEAASIFLTILFILAAINAYNLIDGINWLASGLSLIAFVTYALLFHWMHDYAGRDLCLLLSGTLGAFMIYNKTPARIFLGDSGSLLLGFLLSILSIRLLESVPLHANYTSLENFNIPAVTASLFSVPFFDTIRIFIVRISNGKSPFTADKNHLHHLLLDAGCSHIGASAILTSLTLLTLALSFQWGSNRPDVFIAIQALILGLTVVAIKYIRNRKALTSNPGANTFPRMAHGGKVKLVREQPVSGKMNA